jgi:hypothetical protein
MHGKRQVRPRLPIFRYSGSHDMLMLTESQTRSRGYVDVETVIYVLGRFTQPPKVRVTAKALVTHNLVEEVDVDSWRITTEGRRVLQELVNRPVRKRGHRPARRCTN